VPPAQVPNFRSLILVAREAQRLWAQTPVSSRARILGALRNQIASQACELAELIPPNLARTRADTLIAEVLPLADAARFLERKAYRLLRPKAVGIVGRPLWLWRIGMRREYLPHGLVLVIGPANYPLFLPGVQILQALVAGNAVLIKPGIGGFAVSEFLAQLAAKAGLPDGLFTVLDEDVETAQAAISEGVDKIILTGSVSSSSPGATRFSSCRMPMSRKLSMPLHLGCCSTGALLASHPAVSSFTRALPPPSSMAFQNDFPKSAQTPRSL
jgi:acyl-CoA reductase-like NAD-dependent aldehyde dehydrogenase